MSVPHTSASWTLELNCTCPHCKEYVDLLEAPDFWDGRDLDAIEHGTKRSKGVEVTCPECSEDFTVDCEY